MSAPTSVESVEAVVTVPLLCPNCGSHRERETVSRTPLSAAPRCRRSTDAGYSSSTEYTFECGLKVHVYWADASPDRAEVAQSQCLASCRHLQANLFERIYNGPEPKQ